MFDNVEYYINILPDLKIKAVEVIDPRLPDTSCFIVFFGMKRWVADIFQKKYELLFKFSFCDFRQLFESAQKRVSKYNSHNCLRNLIAVFALENGPAIFFCSNARRPSAMARSSRDKETGLLGLSALRGILSTR